ncbi:phosphatase PAP2 family protein [Kitasatospora sp. NPDC097605]|uniref:phosphatase PAP2 family protein n=1 Tax=Kitasatospora sp. NPDC097605 TaxID=3157226 RepID=UPI0033251511
MGARTGPGPDGRGTVLPPSPRVWLGLTAALGALGVLLLALRYGGEGEPGAVDARIGSVVDGVGTPWRYAALALDALGEPVGAVLLVSALVTGCLLLRRPRAAVFLLAAVGLTVGTATLLKHLVGRTIHGDGNLSYPSGHTAFLTAIALVVAMVAVRRRRGGRPLVLGSALLAGGLMGWAEVALGAHYPTDTLGGWCTALAVTPATGWLVDRTSGRQGAH